MLFHPLRKEKKPLPLQRADLRCLVPDIHFYPPGKGRMWEVASDTQADSELNFKSKWFISVTRGKPRRVWMMVSYGLIKPEPGFKEKKKNKAKSACWLKYINLQRKSIGIYSCWIMHSLLFILITVHFATVTKNTVTDWQLLKYFYASRTKIAERELEFWIQKDWTNCQQCSNLTSS